MTEKENFSAFASDLWIVYFLTLPEMPLWKSNRILYVQFQFVNLDWQTNAY